MASAVDRGALVKGRWRRRVLGVSLEYDVSVEYDVSMEYDGSVEYDGCGDAVVAGAPKEQ